MQIASIGDNLPEILVSVHWEEWVKYFNFSTAEMFTQSAKRYWAKKRKMSHLILFLEYCFLLDVTGILLL